MDDMAVCVAATNPSGVRALLATAPASVNEASSMATLSPTLGRCLQANAKLVGNRQSVRAALAEALYHRYATPASLPLSAHPSPIKSGGSERPLDSSFTEH